MVVTADAVAPSATEAKPGFGVAIRDGRVLARRIRGRPGWRHRAGGMAADLTCLTANVLDTPEALDEAQVTWTMAGGKVTYAS
jgi:hypothetical protein